jgi:hypothetical protein
MYFVLANNLYAIKFFVSWIFNLTKILMEYDLLQIIALSWRQMWKRLKASFQRN